MIAENGDWALEGPLLEVLFRGGNGSLLRLANVVLGLESLHFFLFPEKFLVQIVANGVELLGTRNKSWC